MSGPLQHGASIRYKITATEFAKGLTQLILTRTPQAANKHHGEVVHLSVRFFLTGTQRVKDIAMVVCRLVIMSTLRVLVVLRPLVGGIITWQVQ